MCVGRGLSFVGPYKSDRRIVTGVAIELLNPF
jgi:hypothetical protein